MERRRYKRKNVKIKAEMIVDERIYHGVIDNISERGMNIETDAKDILSGCKDFLPGTKLMVRFHTPEGELLTLNCRVVWSFNMGPGGTIKKIGMEVIFPPPGYIDLCRIDSL
jgi:hypothetical protein